MNKQFNDSISRLIIIILFSAALIIAGALLPMNTLAQGTSINSTGLPPDSSAMLDVSSTTKGTLITRMSTAQRNAIVNPATGLMIFNTDCNELQYYSGAAWISVLSSAANLTAGAITGSNAFCPGQPGIAYSITPVFGASSYIWSLPAGATIASGAGTNSITVNFGSTAGTISVTAGNGCSSGAPASLALTMVSTVGSPGAISGPATVCSGQTGVAYSIASVPAATTYSWSLPSGASITSGAGTNSIVVTFGSNSGSVSVTAGNFCGTSSPSSLAVTAGSAPATPGSISGLTTVSPNQSGVSYSISAVSGATSYNWTVPSGASITAGQGTTGITVTFGTTPGNVCVTASNSCGSGTAACVAVSTCSSGSQTFSYTGAQQTFTVPACVTSVTLDVYGAQGGGGGGLGGRAQGTLAVTAGQTLYVYVGGQGAGYNTGVSLGGWNGGGNGHYGCAGGGGSDIRVGGTALANRVIVAGGGGGYYGNAGGAGGGTTGGNATSGPATGGTQSSGGSYCGALGQGGSNPGGMADGGGGGGGYYGGGTNYCAGASPSNGNGAGGSGYIGGVTGGSMTNGVRSGNGSIIISW